MARLPTTATVDAFMQRTDTPERIKRRMFNLQSRLQGLSDIAQHRNLDVTPSMIYDSEQPSYGWNVSDVKFSAKGVPYIVASLWPNRLTSTRGRDAGFRPPIVIPQEDVSICYMAKRKIFRIFRPFPSWGFKQTKRDLKDPDEVVNYFVHALGRSQGYHGFWVEENVDELR